MNRIRRILHNLRLNWRYILKPSVAMACAVVMLVAFVFLSPWVQVDTSQFPAFGNGNFQLPQGFQGLPNTDSTGTTSDTGSTGFVEPEGFQAPEGFQLPDTQQSQSDTGTTDATGTDTDTGSTGFEAPEGFQAPDTQQSQPSTGTTDSTTNSTLPQGFQVPEGFQPGGGRGAAFNQLTGDQTQGRFLVPVAAVAAMLLSLGGVYRPRFRNWFTAFIFIAGLVALAYFGIYFVGNSVSTTATFLPRNPSLGFWIALVASVGLVLHVFIPVPSTEDEGEGDVSQIVAVKNRSGLSLGQNLTVAFNAMLANKLRSGLTMLGIIIGVASVVALLAVGRGASSAVTDQIEGTGLNLLNISAGGFGRFGGQNTSTLTYEDAEEIAQNIDGITAVLPQYSGNLEIRSDQTSFSTSILGITPDYATINNLEIEIGEFFTNSEYNRYSRVVVLGSSAAEELFSGLNPIGSYVRIDNKRFEVIGVLEEQDGGGFGQDPNLQAYVPLTSAYRSLFNARRAATTDYSVSTITVAVTDSTQVDAVMADVEDLLRDQHDLESDEDNDFNIFNQQTLLETASNISNILTLLLGAIASISLIVGGIGIMNITLVSVTERTREIGLRKAIGARRGHILQQFLIETIFLSVLGGLIGVITGVGIALLTNASVILSARVTPDSIVLGMGFSLLIGLFFGIYPANQAAKLEPIEALCYE